MSSPTPDGVPSAVHIINHTHWDREWFLTHEYTTEWIAPLIDTLGELVQVNGDYEYLFDGQTLVIEDLLKLEPEYRGKVEELIKKGSLTIGPVYSQPDWRLISGELHVRNLACGLADVSELGGQNDVAWLVDTFGHISQTPQLLAMAGIDAVYVWRGVPEMEPFFDWYGANGQRIRAINLFGGYRNLYGITKTPEIAADRLITETDKLAPRYGDLPIPLFDGYDLDSEPEDPVRFYAENFDLAGEVDIHASSPRKYVDAIAATAHGAPRLDGELISGRFGSTFPGTLSTRGYLKLLHHDAEIAIHRKAEPLAALAGARGRPYDVAKYEQWSREMLQNGVHDCICGVSVDQVHERMERSYADLINRAAADIEQSLSHVLAGFGTGTYAISTNAVVDAGTLRHGDLVHELNTSGVGVSLVRSHELVEASEASAVDFEWSNDHYRARVGHEGVTLDDGGRLGRLVIRKDIGDTYSSEPGEILGVCEPTSAPVIESTSSVDAVIRMHTELRLEDLWVTAVVRARFDNGPTIEFDIELDSEGTEFRADFHFETGINSETVYAGMPFDVVARSHVDSDLLPIEIDDDLESILMGQREAFEVEEFPFHGFVAMSDGTHSRAVLARGIRSYSSRPDGTVSVALRRSQEWLARSGLAHRVGDAGPAMYVPGARSERAVTHQLGFSVASGDLYESGILAANDRFSNPPLIASVAGSGAVSEWRVFQEELSLSSLTGGPGQNGVVRVVNLSNSSQGLAAPYQQLSIRGDEQGAVDNAEPKDVLTLKLEITPPEDTSPVSVTLHNPPKVRVGPSRSKPAPRVMAEIADRIAKLGSELAVVNEKLPAAEGNDKYLLRHQTYVLEREQAEMALSLEFNKRLAASTQVVSIPDETDDTIAALGVHLNDLRVKRRIYDYVVQAM